MIWYEIIDVTSYIILLLFLDSYPHPTGVSFPPSLSRFHHPRSFKLKATFEQDGQVKPAKVWWLVVDLMEMWLVGCWEGRCQRKKMMMMMMMMLRIHPGRYLYHPFSYQQDFEVPTSRSTFPFDSSTWSSCVLGVIPSVNSETILEISVSTSHQLGWLVGPRKISEIGIHQGW